MKAFRKNFVALASPSGGGKTTLCRMLIERYPDTCLSISFTTRAPRGAERDGVEYNFVDEARFRQLIAEKALVEWAEVHGNFYGTSRAFLEAQSQGGKVVLFDVDVQGVDSLKKTFGDRCLSVFVLPPSLEQLEQRLRGRNTEAEEKVQERMRNAAAELAHAHRFDHQIVNHDLPSAFRELCALLEMEVGLA